jgi:hypothetical protein
VIDVMHLKSDADPSLATATATLLLQALSQLLQLPTDADRVPGSRIVFFKNGQEQGTAFTDIFSGKVTVLFCCVCVRFHRRLKPAQAPTILPSRCTVALQFAAILVRSPVA